MNQELFQKVIAKELYRSDIGRTSDKKGLLYMWIIDAHKASIAVMKELEPLFHFLKPKKHFNEFHSDYSAFVKCRKGKAMTSTQAKFANYLLERQDDLPTIGDTQTIFEDVMAFLKAR